MRAGGRALPARRMTVGQHLVQFPAGSAPTPRCSRGGVPPAQCPRTVTDFLSDDHAAATRTMMSAGQRVVSLQRNRRNQLGKPLGSGLWIIQPGRGNWSATVRGPSGRRPARPRTRGSSASGRSTGEVVELARNSEAFRPPRSSPERSRLRRYVPVESGGDSTADLRSGPSPDPLLAALVDLLLPQRDALLEDVDRVLASGRASWRCGAETAIATLASPMPTQPVRWWIAIEQRS